MTAPGAGAGSTATACAWSMQAGGGGIIIRVRASPRASRCAVRGVIALPDGPALSIAITAPPADGAANAALVRFLADQLGVAKSTITILAGTSGRIKRVAVAGESAGLIARIITMLPPAE
ncbi:MAG: DUF167 domain-containing protein [Sphingopyxis sp.]